MADQINNTVTLRLDPKLYFGAVLLSRKRNQTLSKTLKQIIDDALAGKFGDGV